MRPAKFELRVYIILAPLNPALGDDPVTIVYSGPFGIMDHCEVSRIFHPSGGTLRTCTYSSTTLGYPIVLVPRDRPELGLAFKFSL